MIFNILIIGFGGAIGSILRFLTTELFLKYTKNFPLFLVKFPLATFTVNILGSMLAGIAYYFIIKNLNNIPPAFKNFILIGLLGGFTTFSTFSLDVLRLFNAGNFLLAFNYISLSLICAISATFASFYLCKIIFS